MKQIWHIINKNTKEVVLVTKKFSKLERVARSFMKLKIDHKFQIQHFIKPEGQRNEELAETVFIASALRAGAAVGHGLLAMKLFEEHSG